MNADPARPDGDRDAAEQVARQVRRGRGSRTGRALARIGIGSRAVVYLALGVLTVQLAFGANPDDADQAGALRSLGRTAPGTLALWLLAAGAGCYVLWRWSQAVTPGSRRDDGAGSRLLAAVEGLAYLPIAMSAALVAAGDGAATEQGDRYRSVSATVMATWPAGRWLVGLVGLVVLGVGGYLASQGPRRSFEADLEFGAQQRARRVVVPLGVVGSTARGLVIAAAGVLVVVAAVTADPDKAGGIDEALRTLAAQAFGPWLLLAVAVGFAAFAAFALAEAVWRRI